MKVRRTSIIFKTACQEQEKIKFITDKNWQTRLVLKRKSDGHTSTNVIQFKYINHNQHECIYCNFDFDGNETKIERENKKTAPGKGRRLMAKRRHEEYLELGPSSTESVAAHPKPHFDEPKTIDTCGSVCDSDSLSSGSGPASLYTEPNSQEKVLFSLLSPGQPIARSRSNTNDSGVCSSSDLCFDKHSKNDFANNDCLDMMLPETAPEPNTTMGSSAKRARGTSVISLNPYIKNERSSNTKTVRPDLPESLKGLDRLQVSRKKTVVKKEDQANLLENALKASEIFPAREENGNYASKNEQNIFENSVKISNIYPTTGANIHSSSMTEMSLFESSVSADVPCESKLLFSNIETKLIDNNIQDNQVIQHLVNSDFEIDLLAELFEPGQTVPDGQTISRKTAKFRNKQKKEIKRTCENENELEEKETIREIEILKRKRFEKESAREAARARKAKISLIELSPLFIVLFFVLIFTFSFLTPTFNLSPIFTCALFAFLFMFGAFTIYRKSVQN